MATHTWISGSSQDWSVAGNWDGGVPTTALSAVVIIKGGTVSISAGLNQDAVEVASIIVERGYTGQIGSLGSPLIISADSIKLYGSGATYIKNGAGTGDDIIDEILIDSANPNVVTVLSGVATASYGNVHCLRGNITMDGSIIGVTNIFLHYHDNPISDVTFTYAAGGATPSLVTQTGGVATITPTVTTMRSIGGQLTKETNTITTLEMLGGRVIFNAVSTASSTITTCRGHAGTLDFMQSGGVKTITTLYQYPGFEWLNNNDRSVHIVTTENNYKPYDKA